MFQVFFLENMEKTGINCRRKKFIGNSDFFFVCKKISKQWDNFMYSKSVLQQVQIFVLLLLSATLIAWHELDKTWLLFKTMEILSGQG
jgi:hypothetical protein